jgi:hypothetical protein
MIAVVAGVFIALFGTGVLSLPLRDFEEYWTAGDVFLRGGNPYDPADLSASLRNATGTSRDDPTMMWNPPWTLPLTVPFAFLPIRLAHVLWVAVQVGLVLGSVRILVRIYGVPDTVRGPLFAAVLLFPPTVFLLVYGQIGGVCLFGVAGFLFFLQRDRPIAAGLCVALTAIKPHLLFAFGLFLILEALVSRRVLVAVLTGAAALAVAAGLAWLINPHVYADYLTGMNAASGEVEYKTVRDWRLPLVSYWLRMWTAPDRFWVQFVPMVVVAVGTAVYWWATRRNRDWPRQTPTLVLFSLLAAPYGGWLFDLVLLLIPVCHAAGAIGQPFGPAVLRRVLIGVVAFNLVVLVVVPAIAGLWLEQYVWFTPLVALAYALAMIRTSAAAPQ